MSYKEEWRKYAFINKLFWVVSGIWNYMYLSETFLQQRDDKTDGKNISKQYSIAIRISHDTVTTGTWDDCRSVRKLRQI